MKGKFLDSDIFKLNVSYFRKGEIYFEKKDFDKSIFYYKKAIDLYPKEGILEYLGSEKLFYSLAETYMMMKDYDNAQKYYHKSLNSINYNYIGASTFKLGKIYFLQDNLEKAQAYFLLSYLDSKKKFFYLENAKYYKLIAGIVEPDFLRLNDDFLHINTQENDSSSQENLFSGLSSIFKDKSIFSPLHFKSEYNVEIKEILKDVEKDEPKVYKENNYNLSFSQTIQNKTIFNTIEILHNNKQQEKPLQFLNYFPNKLIIKKDFYTGKALYVTNKKYVNDSWNQWVEKYMEKYFTTLKAQETCFNLYSKICMNLDHMIQNMPIYWLIFPELYKVKPYVSLKEDTVLNNIELSSLLSGLSIRANLIASKIVQEQQYTIIKGHLKIINKDDLQKMEHKSLEYNIITNYKLKNLTGEIIHADLLIKEKLKNKEYSHFITIKCKEPLNNIENIRYKGKTYTQEEWKKFEEEQFKEYARKNNIRIEGEEKPKQGGRFFLDEKESDI